MRVWVRTSRNTGVSLGPVALLVLSPVIVAAHVLYLLALLVYLAVRGAAWLARAAWRAGERVLTT